jgi:O-antigen/teichoic acid export membrane protein
MLRQRYAFIFSYRVAARGVAAGLQAFCFIVLARDLGADGFGAVAVGISVGSVASILTGLGGGTRALRLRLEDDVMHIATAMFGAQCLSAVLSAFVSWLVVSRLLDEQWWIGLAVGIIVASDALCSLEQAVLAGLGRQAASAGLLLFQRTAPFICLTIGSILSVPAIVGYGAGATIAAIVAIIRPIRGWHRPISLRALIFTSRGYWLSNIVESLGLLDTVLVRFFAGAAAAGSYGIASRVMNPVHIITTSILSIVTPAAAMEQREHGRTTLLRKSTKIALICAAVVVVLSPLVADIAIRILGPDYAPARKMIIGFMIAAAVSGVSQTLVAHYVIEGRAGAVAASLAVGITLGLVAISAAAAIDWMTFLWVGPIVLQMAILTLLVLNRRMSFRTPS